MTTTRRIFMSGLAAVLSVINVPGVWASKVKDVPEAVFDDSEYRLFIEYLEIGECPEMRGGPATEPGWYLHPGCMIGCCYSEGPFHNKEAALEANRIRLEEELINVRSENNDDAEEILFF